MVFIPQLLGDGLQTIEGVAELSLIQGLSPDRVLGRVNATIEVLSHGIAYPIGALAAAVVADVRSASAAGSPSAGPGWPPRSCSWSCRRCPDSGRSRMERRLGTDDRRAYVDAPARPRRRCEIQPDFGEKSRASAKNSVSTSTIEAPDATFR